MIADTGKSLGFLEDTKMAKFTSPRRGNFLKLTSRFTGKSGREMRSKKIGKDTRGKTVQDKILSRVFSEDYEEAESLIFDPRGLIINKWNKIFLAACLVSLFVDPLFFYLPRAKKCNCIESSASSEITLTIIRSLADAFYFVQIYVRFRTAYVAPSSSVFGRGELVIDPLKIASRYLQKNFWLDIVAAVPLPQMLIWAIIPHINASSIVNTAYALRLITIFQYVLRLYLIFPLSSQIIKATGVLLEAAWAGAAYNLMLYMLASHVLGACWYLLSVERQEECWRRVCRFQNADCHFGFFECSFVDNADRIAWFEQSNISSLCNPSSNFFQFGIFADAVSFGVTASGFVDKYFYCLWWGLRNLSSLGQNLLTSTRFWEISFAIIIAILGLVLFGLLIGNMQTFLQSTAVRLEEWRIRRRDTEEWMSYRQLPCHLKQSVRKYDQYRWVATRGVDEELILRDLPNDLRRDIKRHLCIDLVRNVPLFDTMDERMLEAICERLQPRLCTPVTCLVREGDPVCEMLFVVRGRLDSYTTGGGRTGFFNSCLIGPGDFCGEELLTWALDPSSGIIFPSSTRTVKAVTEVEAFAFLAEDLKFIASQYRKLHSKQLRHVFRFHSPQWRTWAACFIQAAWFRHKRRKESDELKKRESILHEMLAKVERERKRKAFSAKFGSGRYVKNEAKLTASTVRGGSQRSRIDYGFLLSVQKPEEPDFTFEDR